MAVNVEGTRNVLSASESAGIKRVIYLSSIAVQGPSPPDNADEEDQLRRTGAPYGDSKAAAEEVVREFWRRKRLSITVIRPTFVWGPRSEFFTVGPVKRIKEGRWFLVDGGQGTCHAVYIDNLVDALLLAGIKDKADGETFIITDDQPCTWLEFFLDYARMVGGDRLPSVSSTAPLTNIIRPPVQLLDRLMTAISIPQKEPARFLARGTKYGLRQVRRQFERYVPFDSWDMAKYARRGGLNIGKARMLLGYKARISRVAGMAETATWLKALGII